MDVVAHTFFFFFNDTATTEIYTLSLHDALPILSNPSGAALDRTEFERIYRLTAERGVFLMTDECYCHFLYDSHPFSIASLEGAKENVLVAGSLSKTYATARTKLVLINSPSNPSGAVLDRTEFERIYRLTAERGVFLMTDECYCHFLYDSHPFSIASLEGAKENVLVAGSLSKTYAM